MIVDFGLSTFPNLRWTTYIGKVWISTLSIDWRTLLFGFSIGYADIWVGRGDGWFGGSANGWDWDNCCYWNEYDYWFCEYYRENCCG